MGNFCRVITDEGIGEENFGESAGSLSVISLYLYWKIWQIVYYSPKFSHVQYVSTFTSFGNSRDIIIVNLVQLQGAYGDYQGPATQVTETTEISTTVLCMQSYCYMQCLTLDFKMLRQNVRTTPKVLRHYGILV